MDFRISLTGDLGSGKSTVCRILSEKYDTKMGYDARQGDYVDMFKAGIIDPTKVVRTALEGAGSVGGLLITTEAMVADKPEDKCGCGHDHGPNMGGMPGMY